MKNNKMMMLVPLAVMAVTGFGSARVDVGERVIKACPFGDPDLIPVVDISGDAFRQTVIAEGAKDRYEGHPTTLLADDGRTMFCVWTTGHGGPCGQMARSDDAGRTWTRLDSRLPAVYGRTHRNCPVLQKLKGPDGKVRYFIYSTKAKEGSGLGIMMSEDLGETWTELPCQPQLVSGMPPTGAMELKNGDIALFGQRFKSRDKAKDRPTDDQAVWMAISKDGGRTYGEMRNVMVSEKRNLCEPCCLRSPDGKSLLLIARENRHKSRSMMSFSHDEGRTWTDPVDTPWALTGDRHEGVLLPDGRYVIAFRDQAVGSATRGQFMAWVGTFDDLVNGRNGQYRIHLLHHHGRKGVWPGNEFDTGYPGVELLPDGTIVCTTYTRHFDDDRQSSVVCTRFRIEETDARLGQPVCTSVESETPSFVQIYNEDDSHFFYGRGDIPRELLDEYVDSIAAGGKVTHFFMCPNAMRANFDSKVFEPAWAPCDVPGWKPSGWSRALKSFHDRGIDPYVVWAKRCREKGISPWLSMRMNDVHDQNTMTYGGHSKFWREHPQFWRKPNCAPGEWGTRALDYAHPEVRAYSLAFVKELLERYDVDGIECDWMRFPNHLTPGRERELGSVLDGLMRDVRALANGAARRLGHPVKVGVRVDSDPEAALARGTDVFTWAKEGSVDLVVPCNFWASADFAMPVADWLARVRAANPAVRVVPGIDANVTIRGEKQRRLTVDEYCGWAHRAYGQGANGIYLFNLFTHPATNGVWKFVVEKGLSPDVVAAHAKSIPENAVRECASVLKQRK